MQELEQLLYDLGSLLKERHGLYIYEIFDAGVESFLKKGIEKTEGVTSPFQGYMHRYEDGTENNVYLFTLDTPAKYYEKMVMPRKSWRIVDDHKIHYRLILNPPEGFKALVLKDLQHLKEYLASELVEDRKRRENAIKKSVAPALGLLEKFGENSAKRYYLQMTVNEFLRDPSHIKLNKVNQQMRSLDRESIIVKRE